MLEVWSKVGYHSTSEDSLSDTDSDDDLNDTQSVLSAAVIGDRKEESDVKMRTPIRGGRGQTDPNLKRATIKASTHTKVSFTKARSEIPYNSGTARRIEGRKIQMGENVEIELPGRHLNGIRCLVIGLWETHENVPYAKLKPLISKQVNENEMDMLTDVGIRVQNLLFLDCKQPEELSSIDSDMQAILDSGATRTIVPDRNYLIRGSRYKLDQPLYFKGYDKQGKAQAARYGGYIALRSNTGMNGLLLIKAFILPTARRALISISQLDDGGNYVDIGGNGLRLRRGPDQSNFLTLTRLEPIHSVKYTSDLQREYEEKWDNQAYEKSSLYPVPYHLFQTKPSDGSKNDSLNLFNEVKGRVMNKIDAMGEINLATRYSEKEKLELRHTQLAHRNMLQLQIMMHWDGDGPRPKAHTVCWCAACVVSKAHAGSSTKKQFVNESLAPLDHVYADCSVDMGESAEGYKHFLCIFETHWQNSLFPCLEQRQRQKNGLLCGLQELNYSNTHIK